MTRFDPALVAAYEAALDVDRSPLHKSPNRRNEHRVSSAWGLLRWFKAKAKCRIPFWAKLPVESVGRFAGAKHTL